MTKLTTWISSGAIHHVFFNMDIPTRHRTTGNPSRGRANAAHTKASAHFFRIVSLIDSAAMASGDPLRRPSWSVAMPRWALRSECPQVHACESRPNVRTLKINYRMLTKTTPRQKWARWKIVTPDIALSSVPYRARYLSERLSLPEANPGGVPADARDPNDDHILVRALSQALSAGWPTPTAAQAAGTSSSETDQFHRTYEMTSRA